MSMYLDHFGLSEPPFRITPHTEFFFAGANRGATLDALVYAIVHDEGIVKVSGEVGSGKTMLCRVLIERLPANVVTLYLANPSLSRDDILFSIADELELRLPDDTRMSAVVRTLQTRLIEIYSQGRQIVVLIDEAHAMPRETLEEIRLLSNLETSQHKLLQLVLFGQPELDDVLAQPNMRQLKERITQNFCLEPLRRDDISQYLDFRMRTAGYRGPNVFAPAAIRRIADASQGLTRRVNILADKSLLAAYAENSHEVTPKQVDAAVRDADYGSPKGPLRRWSPVLGGVFALLVLAIASLVWMPGNQAISGTAPAPAAAPSAGDGSGVVTSPVAAPAAPRQAAESALQPKFDQTRQWIEATTGDRWVIQLATVDGRQTEFARTYFGRASGLLPADQVRMYLAGSDNDPRIGIIYGEFPSWRTASEAARHLPTELLDHSPFPRQVRWLK
jgi:type II secretory pathway predicted ATPase ExeA